METPRPVIRNWRDQDPANSHGAVGWKVMMQLGTNPGRTYEEAPLIGIHGITYRLLQPTKAEPPHTHAAKEHVYYIVSGTGAVQLGEERFPVKEGDAVYMPAHGCPLDHQRQRRLPGTLRHQRDPALGGRAPRRRPRSRADQSPSSATGETERLT